MGLPHVDGALGGQAPADDVAVGVAREQMGVVAGKVQAVDVGGVAAEDAGGQGGRQSGHVEGLFNSS